LKNPHLQLVNSGFSNCASLDLEVFRDALKHTEFCHSDMSTKHFPVFMSVGRGFLARMALRTGVFCCGKNFVGYMIALTKNQAYEFKQFYHKIAGSHSESL
jgi:hypothetical protein